MSDLGAEPRLVVPEGLVIDESARERLERRLALVPPEVVGIAAPTSELAPGTSYRVFAEWRSLEGSGRLPVASDGVRGAVLVRPDVAFEVSGGRVVVSGGSVLVDAGAHVHDPYTPIGALATASELGRPPFPRRPVVVFLGCADDGAGSSDAAATDWLRRLVNRLVRRDVEARIALPHVGDGLHLTRPCLPSEASIHALAPDIIVTLDQAAVEQVDAWCAGNRSTVFVGFEPQLADPMELVSWQLGRAQGRLRARIGPRVDVPAFASLIGRLCAGPQPIPPSDEKILVDSRQPVRERWTTAAAEGVDAEPGCVVLTGSLDAAARLRLDGLVDNLAAARVPVTSAALPGVPAAARTAALVVLAGVMPSPEVDALVGERRAAGRPAVVDLGVGDLDLSTDGREPRLTVAAAGLVAACGRVTAPLGAAYAAAQEAGVRALVVPTLFTREDAAALRDARLPVDPTAPLVIGWNLTGLADPDGGHPRVGLGYVDAVAAGIASALIDRRNAVELVGDPTGVGGVADALVGHERVTVIPAERFDPSGYGKWTVHVWTPPLLAGLVVGDARQFEAVSCAGVPSVMAADAAGAIDGFISPYVLVQAPHASEEWADALHHVLDDAGRRDRRTREAVRRADAVDSAAIAKAVVGRFVGWAGYRAPDREPVTA